MDYTIDTTYKYSPAEWPYPGTLIYGPDTIRRVTINNVNGKPFNLDDTYLVFTNDFCANGGDSFYKFTEAEKMFDTSVLDIDSLALYITEGLNGVIDEKYAESEGRIHIKEPSIEAKAVKVTYNGKAPNIPASSIKGNAGPVKYRDYSVKNGTKSIKAPVNAGNDFCKAYIPEDDETYSAVESNMAAVTIGRATAKIKAIKPSRKKVKRGKTYTIKVRAVAAQNRNFNSAKRVQKVKIKVK